MNSTEPMTVNRCVNCGKIELHKHDDKVVWKLPPPCFRESERVTFIATVCPECEAKQVAFSI
jgi:ribosomal protein S27E